MLMHVTYCGLVTRYGDIDLGQHWLRLWLVAQCTVTFICMQFHEIDKSPRGQWVKHLILLVLKPEYLGITRSILWLLMPWFMSPGDQQPWYRLRRILVFTRKVFNCLLHPSVEKLWKMQRYYNAMLCRQYLFLAATIYSTYLPVRTDAMELGNTTKVQLQCFKNTLFQRNSF